MTGIKPGDLLFVWGNDWIAKEIEEVTHGASHVAMFLSDSKLIEAQGMSKIHELDATTYLDKRTEIWSDPSLTDEERQKIVIYAKTLYGEEYDYLLILFELAHFTLGEKINGIHEHHKLICSTFVNKCAKEIGKTWTNEINPAPVDLLKGGVLVKTDCSLLNSYGEGVDIF